MHGESNATRLHTTDARSGPLHQPGPNGHLTLSDRACLKQVLQRTKRETRYASQAAGAFKAASFSTWHCRPLS